MIREKKEKIVVWGYGDQHIVNREIYKSNNLEIIAIIDEYKDGTEAIDYDKTFFRKFEEFEKWIVNKPKKEEIGFVISIGNPYGKERLNKSSKMKSLGLREVGIKHPKSIIAESTLTSKSYQIMAGVIVNPGAILGEQIIINTRAIIEHNVEIGNGCEIGPGATILGRVKMGNNVWVGANAVILPRLKVGSNVIIGAGAVVTKDVDSDSVVVGNPARKLRNFTH